MDAGLDMDRRTPRDSNGGQRPPRPSGLRRHARPHGRRHPRIRQRGPGRRVTTGTGAASADTPVAHAALPVSPRGNRSYPTQAGRSPRARPSRPPWTVPARQSWSVTETETCGRSTSPTGPPPRGGLPTPGSPSTRHPRSGPRVQEPTTSTSMGAMLPQPTVGGYYAFNNTGGQIWHDTAPDLNGQHGVQASPAVGVVNGVLTVVAPSLGQNEYAFNALTGATLPGWPFFTADSGFSTPSLADLYGNGQTEIVEGATRPPDWPTACTTPRVDTCGWSVLAATSSVITTPTRPSTRHRPSETSLPGERPASHSAPVRTTAEPRTPTCCTHRTPTATSCGVAPRGHHDQQPGHR